MKIHQPERKTIFVTFYSFKGGVGRTMALVNAACILAGRGRRVLMIDFDLEAPGLTMLALKQLASPAEICPAGLVDLIYDVLTDPANSPLADKENPTGYTEYVCSLNIPEHLLRIEGGKLDLMPSGRLDAGYEERLYSIDFAEIYAEGIGQPLFKHLKNLVRDSKLYDYILIDSRTGFSDEGGICTRDLADHIVALTGLNQQNIDGTVRFLTRLKASGWKEGEVLFILSPIPTGYEDLIAERMDYARQEIEKTGFKADFKVFIYYHPRLALDEEPFVYPWANTSLFYTYKLVCEVIQELVDDTPQVWVNRAIEAFGKGQFEEGMRCFNQVQIDDMLAAPSARSTILNILMLVISQMPIDDILAKQNMIQNAINSLQTTEESHVVVLIIMQYVEALRRTDNLQIALEYLDEQWHFIQSHASADTQADVHILRGQIRLKLNDATGAIEDAEAALKFYHSQKVQTQSAKDANELLQKAKELLK